MEAAVESYGTRSTFCGVAHRRLEDIAPGEVVILGAPFDWGTSHRPGARFGPRAIRQADYLGPNGRRPHLTLGVNALEDLPVVDAGDIPVYPGYLERTIESVEKYVYAVVEAGAIPIILGGDHTIALPDCTAVARRYGFGNVAVVHFDAHADTGESAHGELYGHGTPMRRLIESGAIPGHRFAQIGLRGYWPGPAIVKWMQEQGMRSYFMDDIVARGLDQVLDEAIAQVGADTDAVFVSVDVDVVDPGSAPGTGTPEPGGLTPRQLLDAVRRLGQELNVVGADVVEVSPVYDQPADTTAMLANRVVLELTSGMAARRRA